MLEIRRLYKRFNLHAGLFATTDRFVYAVNGIDLTIAPGEIYGLVGESGCGKTTLARLIVGVYPVDSGAITFGVDQQQWYLHSLSSEERRVVRAAIKYIFQDPARSLNPRLRVFDILVAGYRYSPLWDGKTQARDRAAAALQAVGLKADDLKRRPADFSGGQRQRIAIARALIAEPRLLICDEVVSALDVSTQSQILNLLLELRAQFRFSMLFIAHDLSVVSYICDRVGVMYRGLLVEEADARSLASRRLHPYTDYLYAAIPPHPSEPKPPSVAYDFGNYDPTQRPSSWELLDDQLDGASDGRPGLEEVSPNHFVATYFRQPK